MVLAQQSGWGLDELLNLEEDEVVTWLDVSERIGRRRMGS